MTAEQYDTLISTLFDTTLTVPEALEACGFKADPLIVEDQLMLRGLETCVECGVWLPANELNQDDEPCCSACLD